MGKIEGMNGITRRYEGNLKEEIDAVPDSEFMEMKIEPDRYPYAKRSYLDWVHHSNVRKERIVFTGSINTEGIQFGHNISVRYSKLEGGNLTMNERIRLSKCMNNVDNIYLGMNTDVYYQNANGDVLALKNSIKDEHFMRTELQPNVTIVADCWIDSDEERPINVTAVSIGFHSLPRTYERERRRAEAAKIILRCNGKSQEVLSEVGAMKIAKMLVDAHEEIDGAYSLEDKFKMNTVIKDQMLYAPKEKTEFYLNRWGVNKTFEDFERQDIDVEKLMYTYCFTADDVNRILHLDYELFPQDKNSMEQYVIPPIMDFNHGF